MAGRSGARTVALLVDAWAVPRWPAGWRWSRGSAGDLRERRAGAVALGSGSGGGRSRGGGLGAGGGRLCGGAVGDGAGGGGWGVGRGCVVWLGAGALGSWVRVKGFGLVG